jgi:hypothetical protein
MNNPLYIEHWFPFGSAMQKVQQKDRSPKKIFVLGVYASAVHAKLLSTEGKTLVTALAVGSEPRIFWRGENPEQTIDFLFIKEENGSLVPSDKRYNGPSGKALDDLILSPLGFSRNDAWLCDLIPYCRLNPNQYKAIQRDYQPLVDSYGYTPCTVPRFSRRELYNKNRRKEILDELILSEASTLVLLGDLPIKHFLSHYIEKPLQRLSQFGEIQGEYGRSHLMCVAGKQMEVIPLVHPRQAGKLGKSSLKWSSLHSQWIKDRQSKSSKLIGQIFAHEPEHWGLQGDPYLWFDMKIRLTSGNTINNLRELEDRFREAYRHYVGSELILGRDIFVEKYSIGGMSSSLVSGRFWERVALPLLKRRWKNYYKNQIISEV